MEQFSLCFTVKEPHPPPAKYVEKTGSAGTSLEPHGSSEVPGLSSQATVVSLPVTESSAAQEEVKKEEERRIKRLG